VWARPRRARGRRAWQLGCGVEHLEVGGRFMLFGPLGMAYVGASAKAALALTDTVPWAAR
jgi:hypothetical protein